MACAWYGQDTYSLLSTTVQVGIVHSYTCTSDKVQEEQMRFLRCKENERYTSELKGERENDPPPPPFISKQKHKSMPDTELK